MKKKLIFFLFLVLLFVAGMGVKYFILDKQSRFGQLKVLSTPSASVFLNDAASGKTPYDDKVRPGDYILKLIPEGAATDAASWQGKITVYKNALTYVERELGASDLTSAGVIFTTSQMTERPKNKDTGEVELETDPAGAIVYLDNEEKGVAPLILADIAKGEHELAVYVPGFFRRTQKINIEPYFRTVGKFKLALDQSQKKVEEIIDEASASADMDTNKEATVSASAKAEVVVVKDTPTGWLRVRAEPSLSASESARVYPKDQFDLLEEKSGWYKIAYEKGREGWISAQYAEKQSD